jgi:hypothetical protein
MSSLEERLDRLGKALEELARSAQEKIEQAMEIGSRKIDLMNLKRSVDRELIALGQVALVHLRAGTPEALTADPAAAASTRRLTELEAQIQKLEAEIEAARQNTAGRH